MKSETENLKVYKKSRKANLSQCNSLINITINNNDNTWGGVDSSSEEEGMICNDEQDESPKLRHNIQGLNANPLYGAGLEKCTLNEHYDVEKRQITRNTKRACFI